MSKVTNVSLSSLVLSSGDFVDGPFGSNLKASEYVDHGIPVLRLQNVRPNQYDSHNLRFISGDKAKNLQRHNYRVGDVVITKLGEPCGVACQIPEDAQPGIIVADVVRFRGDSSRIDHRYLVHFLNSQEGKCQVFQFTKGTTRKRINLSDLKKIQIPLPPIEEQRRIAAILDKADAVRRKREEAIRLTEELLRSLFLDMFGDPVTNPMGWEVDNIKNFGGVITGNTPPRSKPENYGNSIEWIKSDNINTPMHFLTKAEEGLSCEGKKIGRVVPPGSVLVICIAGSRPSIGRVALTDREVAFNQQINAIVPNSNVDPYFLYSHFFIAQHLVQAQSTESMKGLVSKSKFSNIQFIKPTEEKQQEFGKIFVKFHDWFQNLHQSAELSKNLFNSLLQKAFRGEL